MKILILGGTGAMGVELTKLFHKTPNTKVFITSRTHNESYDNIQYIQGNAKDTIFINELLSKDWDLIVDFMVYSTENFSGRIGLLLKATKHYIFLSSARVYANSDTMIKEDSPRLLDISKDIEYLATDEYALTKARQEDLLKNSNFKNWTIIRPYISYNYNRLQLGVLEKEDWLYRAIKNRTIVFSEDICSKMTTMTLATDVAKAIHSISGENNAKANIFHITSNKSIRWAEILEIYLDLLEEHLKTRPKVLLQNYEKFTQTHNAKYQIIYDRLYDRTFDNEKISKYIDITNFSNAREGLNIALKHFLQNPKFKNINWEKEALRDKQTKEWTSLFEIKGFKNKIKYIHKRIF